MQSFNVVTRSNANVVACSPSNLLGQQAFIYITYFASVILLLRITSIFIQNILRIFLL